MGHYGGLGLDLHDIFHRFLGEQMMRHHLGTKAPMENRILQQNTFHIHVFLINLPSDPKKTLKKNQESPTNFLEKKAEKTPCHKW